MPLKHFPVDYASIYVYQIALVAGIYGGSDEDRTRYLLHAMEALSQVSYGPITAQLLYIKRLFRQYDFIVFLYLVFLLSLFIDIISTAG